MLTGVFNRRCHYKSVILGLIVASHEYSSADLIISATKLQHFTLGRYKKVVFVIDIFGKKCVMLNKSLQPARISPLYKVFHLSGYNAPWQNKRIAI